MEFRQIKNYPDYWISDNGDVFSAKYNRWKKRKAQKTVHGYFMVGLYVGGVADMCFVHRLVADAFIENPHGKPQVNHLDGDKTNNKVYNLEWATRSENMRHAQDTCLWNTSGIDNHFCRTEESAIRKVCEMLQDGYFDLTKIEKETGVTKRTIYKIRAGTAYRKIIGDYNIPKPFKMGQRIPDNVIKDVCTYLNQGLSGKKICEITGLGKGTVSDIKLGKTYTNISKDYLGNTR